MEEPANTDCVGHEKADAFRKRLSSFQILRRPPVPGICQPLEPALKILPTSDSVAFEGCRIAVLAARVARLIGNLSVAETPSPNLLRDTTGNFADGTFVGTSFSLLPMLGSRWPIFGLLAWLQALLRCRPDVVSPAELWDCDRMDEFDDGGSTEPPFWQLALATSLRVAAMGHEIVWINSARVAFDAAAARRSRTRCPVGFASLVLVRGLMSPWGDSSWSGALAAVADLTDALAAGAVGLSELLFSRWPFYALCNQLSDRVDHFVGRALIAYATPLQKFSDDLYSQSTLSNRLCGPGMRAVVVVAVDVPKVQFFISWLIQLRRSGFRNTIVAVCSASTLSSCQSSVTAPLVDGTSSFSRVLCVEAESASLQLEMCVVALCLLRGGLDAIVLDSDALILDDPLIALLPLLCLRDTFYQVLSDRPAAVAHDDAVHMALRYLRGPLGLSMMMNAVHASYSNPFLRPLDWVARRPLSSPTELLLPTSAFAHARDIGTDQGLVTFHFESPWLATLYRPILLGRGAKRWAAFSRLCRLRLIPHCHNFNASATLKMSEPYDDDDAAFRKRFILLFVRGPEKSGIIRTCYRPRVFQIGPSGCGTTAIHEFFQARGLITAKAFKQHIPLQALIQRALIEGKEALFYLQGYDAYTDFLNPLQSKIPKCSIGCQSQNESVRMNVVEYLRLVGILAEQYPNSKFVYNVRDLRSWLAGRAYNCWPLISPRETWDLWMVRWTHCCDPQHLAINASCGFDEGGVLPLLGRDGSARWVSALDACCEPLPLFSWAWHAMRVRVESLFSTERSRLLVFNIDEDNPEELSHFIGVKHEAAAWHKAHASERKVELVPLIGERPAAVLAAHDAYRRSWV